MMFPVVYIAVYLVCGLLKNADYKFTIHIKK